MTAIATPAILSPLLRRSAPAATATPALAPAPATTVDSAEVIRLAGAVREAAGHLDLASLTAGRRVAGIELLLASRKLSESLREIGAIVIGQFPNGIPDALRVPLKALRTAEDATPALAEAHAAVVPPLPEEVPALALQLEQWAANAFDLADELEARWA